MPKILRRTRDKLIRIYNLVRHVVHAARNAIVDALSGRHDNILLSHALSSLTTSIPSPQRCSSAFQCIPEPDAWPHQPAEACSSFHEQLEQPARDALLPILLLQPCFMETRIVGRMLCTNKTVHALIWQMCTGQVPVSLPDQVNTTTTQQFASWVARQGHLMQSLKTGSFAGLSTKRLQALTLATGLQAAAASPLGLQLSEYHSASEDTCSTFLLAQLPAAHLTSLTVHITATRDTLSTAAAITSLGRLRSLKLAGRVALKSSSPVLAALPALTALTSLHIKRLLPSNGLAFLAALPASLQELRISRAKGPREGQLDLGRLTALKTLQVDYGRANSALSAIDILPPNVVSLCLNGCPTVKPLLQLAKLQHLTLTNTPAYELLQLRLLLVEGQLRSLHLQYDSSGQQPLGAQSLVDAVAADAWAELPCLRDLSVVGCNLEPAVVTGLGDLQGLTRLAILNCNIAARTQQLASALHKMSSLVELDLEAAPGANATLGSSWHYKYLSGGGAIKERRHCLQSLMAAIEHLGGDQPGSGSLRSLRLVCPSFYGEPSDISALVHASQVTRLCLGESACSDMDDIHCLMLARGMPQLRELRLATNSLMTDASLATISAVLTQLTHLDLSVQGTFSVDGVRCLTQLKKLSVLALPLVLGEGAGDGAERFDAAMRHRMGLPPPVDITL